MRGMSMSLLARALVLALAGNAATALGQTATATPTGPVPATAAKPTAQLVSSFTDLAGSPENATALVNGLRTGTSITLATADAAGTSTTFSPGTKPMGYGNIRIALSLARSQLTSQGITAPSPEQLQGALMGTVGSDGTTTQGILQMRASGMGWGQISNSMGIKLGSVMGSGAVPSAGAAGSAPRPTVTTAAGSAGGMPRGVTTAMGGSPTTGAHGSGRSTVTAAGGAGGGNAAVRHSGITTAGGAGGHVASALGQGGGAHAGSGAVNAAGARPGALVASAAGGNGKGHGKP